MRKTSIILASIAAFGLPVAIGAEPDPGEHQGKRMLHNADVEEQTYKVCNRNEEHPVMKVYVGERAKVEQVKFGECKEFKSNQISVDKPEKEKERPG